MEKKKKKKALKVCWNIPTEQFILFTYIISYFWEHCVPPKKKKKKQCNSQVKS